MESSQQEDIKQIQAGTIYSVSNGRRVLTQLRKFTDPTTGTSALLGADCMYGANVMDGKCKVFSLGDLTPSKKALTE